MNTKTSVLVINDDPLAREKLNPLLSMLGFTQVVLCDNGNEALEYLYTTSIDLVITEEDLSMMDGIEFTKRIRSDAPLRTLPVIMLGNSTTPSYATSIGVNEYLVKPVSFRDLHDAVKRILQQLP